MKSENVCTNVHVLYILYIIDAIVLGARWMAQILFCVLYFFILFLFSYYLFTGNLFVFFSLFILLFHAGFCYDRNERVREGDSERTHSFSGGRGGSSYFIFILFLFFFTTIIIISNLAWLLLSLFIYFNKGYTHTISLIIKWHNLDSKHTHTLSYYYYYLFEKNWYHHYYNELNCIIVFIKYNI